MPCTYRYMHVVKLHVKRLVWYYMITHACIKGNFTPPVQVTNKVIQQFACSYMNMYRSGPTTRILQK